MADFKSGEVVQLKGAGMPVCPMLVDDSVPPNKDLVYCIWLDKELRLQLAYFHPALLESAAR